jgi:hypothetical protein
VLVSAARRNNLFEFFASPQKFQTNAQKNRLRGLLCVSKASIGFEEMGQLFL